MVQLFGGSVNSVKEVTSHKRTHCKRIILRQTNKLDYFFTDEASVFLGQTAVPYLNHYFEFILNNINRCCQSVSH